MDSQRVKSVDQLRIEMFVNNLEQTDVAYVFQELCRYVLFVATILLNVVCLTITILRLDVVCVALWTWIIAPLWAWTFVPLWSWTFVPFWAWTFAPLLTWIHHRKSAKKMRSVCKFLSRHLTFSRVYYGSLALAVSTIKFCKSPTC
jgi:fatty acid desaturase